MKRAFEWCLDCRWQVWGIRTQVIVIVVTEVNPWHKYINIVICITMQSLRELPLQKCIYSGRMYRIDQKKSVLNKCCYFEHRNKYISVVPFFFSTCCSVAIHLCHSLNPYMCDWLRECVPAFRTLKWGLCWQLWTTVCTSVSSLCLCFCKSVFLIELTFLHTCANLTACGFFGTLH